MAGYQDVIYEIKDQVARLTINRPGSMNAMTRRTLHEIDDAIADASTNREVGVLVITGAGERAFCVGGDMKVEADEEEELVFNADRLILNCPKPVIARINGYSIGGGNHIAYFCDISIAAEHAIFGQNGPRVASPASGHVVGYLANIVGHKRAREMWMLCRRYTAREILEWGLVNAVVPYEQLDEEVDKWCRELLALSPTCLKVVKQTFADNVDHVMKDDVKDVLARVAPDFYESGEQDEGIAAFVEKRAPDFSRWR